ncbi:hypothetical protein NC652_033425 [Populus alba x Populus x berolinensis]|nr:hypothetical protein NC652_033425 [Populus alba x Populus x berolinensis]
MAWDKEGVVIIPQMMNGLRDLAPNLAAGGVEGEILQDTFNLTWRRVACKAIENAFSWLLRRGKVSCDDILALSARDSVAFQFKNPELWVEDCLRSFGGLDRHSFPVLQFLDAPSKFQEQRPPQPGQQPALQLHRKRRRRPFPEPNIRCFLKKPKCKILNDAATTVEIDPGSSQNFDTAYFAILKQREGIFQSDAALLTNRTPNKIVGELLNSNVFFRQFAQPMKRMGAIGVLPGTSGEIRKKCIVINS